MLRARTPQLLLLVALAYSASACTSEAADDTAGSSSSESSSASESQSTEEDSATTGETLPEGCTPELEALRSEVFTPSCALAGCHDSMNAVAGLDLGAVDLEAELVGQPAATCDGWIRVVPGAPEDSLLYAKIAGEAPCGALMPPPNGLPAEQVECIGAWIANLEGMSCETCGGDACVDLDSDPAHCGACDNACPEGVSCTEGACSCPDGLELCEGVCVDTSADPDNCGSCGEACAPEQACAMGTCAEGCGELTDCDGSCVDTSTDANHCGGCGNVCPGGNACEMGSCGCPGDGVDFAAEVEPLLDNSCAGPGCHGFPQASAGLDLRTGQSYDALVGVPSSQCNERLLVSPGSPAESYLMNKLEGVDMCSGSQMPKGAGSLSAGELAMISEWICRGAAN